MVKMENQAFSLKSEQIRDEFTISSLPVMVGLTVMALVLVILTGQMTNIVAHGFLLSTRLELYFIIIAGWLIHFQNPRIAKWFLVFALPIFVFESAASGPAPELFVLAFLPVGVSAAMLGPAAGMLAAGIFTGLFLVPAIQGAEHFTSRQVIFSLAAVWGMAVFMVAVYRPILIVGNWIENFYNQALTIRAESDHLRMELNQALEDMLHINRQLESGE